MMEGEHHHKKQNLNFHHLLILRSATLLKKSVPFHYDPFLIPSLPSVFSLVRQIIEFNNVV